MGRTMFSIMNQTSFRVEAIGLLATSAGCLETTLRTANIDLEVLEMARDFEIKSPGARRRVINLLDRAIKQRSSTRA
jgi:hypothetical protein